MVVNQAARRNLSKVDVSIAPVPSENPELGYGPSFVSEKMVFEGEWNSSFTLEVWMKLLWVLGLRLFLTQRSLLVFGWWPVWQRVAGIHGV